MRLFVTPEADDDIGRAVRYYEAERAGLGDEFLRSVERLLFLLTKRPFMYQQRHRTVRRALLRRFPYAIAYRVRGEVVEVLAVTHTAREPSHWQRRA